MVIIGSDADIEKEVKRIPSDTAKKDTNSLKWLQMVVNQAMKLKTRPSVALSRSTPLTRGVPYFGRRSQGTHKGLIRQIKKRQRRRAHLKSLRG